MLCLTFKSQPCDVTIHNFHEGGNQERIVHNLVKLLWIFHVFLDARQIRVAHEAKQDDTPGHGEPGETGQWHTPMPRMPLADAVANHRAEYNDKSEDTEHTHPGDAREFVDEDGREKDQAGDHSPRGVRQGVLLKHVIEEVGNEQEVEYACAGQLQGLHKAHDFAPVFWPAPLACRE